MKTEKDLDNLFKKGLEEPGNYKHYQEEDWDSLETMLDKQKKRSGIIYWLPILSGVAALLILAFGWYFIIRGTDKNHASQLTGITKHHSESNIADHSGTITQNQIIPGTGGRPIQQQVVLNKKFRLPEKGLINTGSTKNKSFLTLSAVDAGRGNTGTDNDHIAINNSAVELTAVNKSVFDSDELNNSIVFNTLKLPVDKASNTANKKIIKNQPGFNPRMAITVLASSTLNGVGSFSQSKAGADAGLLFSIGVTKKFTLSTGAVYAKTPYLTDFYNYHTAYQFKTNPESVNADCRILDIPLNIDYQLLSKSRNKLSVGSGLSSYIMLRENYHYNYTVPGTPGPTDFNVINKNQYFMGVLNLEATYQRQINSKLSLAVQPYLKMPLTDIGNGEVKLQSTGVAVGLSWNINTLKR